MSVTSDQLLMSFIKDGYTTQKGMTKKTALKMMNYVAENEEMQRLVNIGDWKSVANLTPIESQLSSQVSASTKANHLRVKALDDELSRINDNFYLLPKNPCIGTIAMFMCVPSVIEGEWTSTGLYHAWCKDWSNWPNNK